MAVRAHSPGVGTARSPSAHADNEYTGAPLGEGRAVKLVDVLARARGPKYAGIERGIWVFALGHCFGLLFLVVCRTYLGDRVRGLWHWQTATWTDFLYVSYVVAALVCHTRLYRSLFGSNPGWVSREDFSAGPAPPGICPWCRAQPPPRSRHDHHTGQCVIKFDHFCPILGTAIGDCNHAGFWLYNISQAFITSWGMVLAFQSSGRCLWSTSLEVQAACWQGYVSWTTLRTVLLLIISLILAAATNFFAGLFVLHTILAATGQTTYEAVKGASVPYLAPFYENYRGPMRPLLRGNEMQLLLQRYLQSQPPPTPFSQGFCENLNVFLFAPKPHNYRIRELPNTFC